MTQKDKDLLLKDLCARLPYEVKCQVETIRGKRNILLDCFNIAHIFNFPNGLCKDCKPYLRPMSSMTEEEKKELWWATYCNDPNITEQSQRHINWLNANHFDYRGLIPKGLAIEAPEGIYD